MYIGGTVVNKAIPFTIALMLCFAIPQFLSGNWWYADGVSQTTKVQKIKPVGERLPSM
jgi:Na+-transporting NADH:ubiquinone oxidoreductase subunit NqrB